MDKKEKIIIIMLILAILFSTFSVIISLGVSKFDIPKFGRPASGQVIGGSGDGGIGFIVESGSGGEG